MRRPQIESGRSRKVRTLRSSVWRPGTAAAPYLRVYSLPRPSELRAVLEQRVAAEDEVAAGSLRRVSGAKGRYMAPAPAADAGRGGRGGFAMNTAAAYQRIRQLGVNYLLGVNMGPSPWTEENVRRAVQTAKDAGLVAYNSMINLPNSVIYGKDSRTKDMEPFLASIEAAGKGGLTVVEYNFYAHRAIEGYYETVGRANAGYTGFDYDLELLVDENGVLMQPVYRDENGKITPETLAEFPNAKKVNSGTCRRCPTKARTSSKRFGLTSVVPELAVPAAEKAGFAWRSTPTTLPRPSVAAHSKSWEVSPAGST